ncbi:uncharacterized protein LOC129918644 isoform X2 [Episyrphus balteatus]|uniref:uncharacterized protein LOC129918644 isoform X2 n=1 Tax=Episyrphus balteatus TaxID=286459 RepID=UPI002484D93C|nr:uncharacterized protein LOC129918644 isoform X2 [Episyrphus balteatus]
MRSDQSGGLLHLKISSPSSVTLINQKAVIKATTSTPIISRVESSSSSSRPGPASRTQRSRPQEDNVIDLDSSPEKTQDCKSTPRGVEDQRKLEFDLKKPPDNKKEDEDNQDSSKMQQTDKVRDSIQKSTEEVEEVKSGAVDRLKCEQNKENLQSNEALKKDSDNEVVTMKVETEAKDAAAASIEDMDTNEQEANDESTIKASSGLAISSVSTLKVDIKEEKPDNESTTPPVTEDVVSTASKVTVEDVPEKETNAAASSPHPVSSASTNKRRRSSSSSLTVDKSKTSKSTIAPTTTESNQEDDEEYIHPTKKLREELQIAYPAHDRILNEYIEKTSNDSIDTIQRHIDQMVSEIHTLNDMIKAKEVEWNNMLHLKKVKEEICFRLTRRKQCLEIMSTKVGETGGRSAGLDDEYMMGNESAIILGGKNSTPAKTNIQLSSTPIAAAISSLSSNICNFTAVSSSSTTAPTTAQLIIQNRANMKSSDLVKEKANTLRLHRNILPKPNTASANTSTASNTAAPTNNSQQQQQQSPSTNGPTSTQQQPNASNQPILNSYLTATDSVQQLVDMMNGHHNHSGLQNGLANNSQSAAAAMVGRQGPFKDVRSIIADFRQQHPEVVPRRGRRVKTNNNNSNLSDSNTILGNALKSDTNSRPSSNDSSSQSMTTHTNQVTTNHNSVNSFKDVLAPFSKSQGAVRSAGGQQQNPPYPEVTLHPVSTPLNASGGQDQPTGSLLHGILTKFSRPSESANTKSAANQASANYISNFSPTLARLLTAPERISPSGAGSGPNQSHHNSSVGMGGDGGSNINNSGSGHQSMPGFGVNLSKVVGHNSEITITPVMNSMNHMNQQSILQQQLQQQQIKDVLTRAAAAVSAANNSAKDEHFLKLSSFVAPSAPNNDDDAEDSVDRLVIDEGDLMNVGGEEHHRIAPHAIGQEFNENEVPVCQGCKKHEAQFVCAGCGNQWYCSRECQVSAWDDHSEVCTATKQIRNNFNMLKSRDLEKDEEYLIIRRRKKNKFLPQFY